MSGLSTTKLCLWEIISEIIGYKSGLALSVDELKKFTLPDYRFIFEGKPENYIIIRSEEFEQIIAYILYHLGKVSSSDITNFIVKILHKYNSSEGCIYAIISLYTAYKIEITQITHTIPMPDEFRGKKYNYIIEHIATSLCIYIRRRIDDKSYKQRNELWMSMLRYSPFHIHNELINELQIAISDFVISSPWLKARTIDGGNTRPLIDLFESEEIKSDSGEFFDQRFIDFLSVNSMTLREINWRQFEGLTAEFFKRIGYTVEIGKGRNDDGIDVRAWSTSPNEPQQLIIQCKRQKEKVGKVIVKSLWADIENEGANQGLIVTTSELSHGARNTIKQRGYPIIECNYADLQKWLLILRTPFTGIFYPSHWKN